MRIDCNTIIENAIRTRLTPREIEIARFYIASIASMIDEEVMLVSTGETPAILDIFSNVESSLSQYQSGEYSQGRECYQTIYSDADGFSFVPLFPVA